MSITRQTSGHAKPSNLATSERRRRERVAGVTQGWLVPDTGDTSDPWEVRICDVSRLGVGFESSMRMNSNDIIRIRIGRGPLHLARRLRIVTCRPGDNGTFLIGGEFIAD